MLSRPEDSRHFSLVLFNKHGLGATDDQAKLAIERATTATNTELQRYQRATDDQAKVSTERATATTLEYSGISQR